MKRIYFGLSSNEGDRLGHLVRGVQMLRSYGAEAAIDQFSDVVQAQLGPDQPPALACVVGGTTQADLAALQGICRETEWALGKEPGVFAVHLLQVGMPVPAALGAIWAGDLHAGMIRALPSAEFARLCEWGQQLYGEESDVIGEWPSAAGP